MIIMLLWVVLSFFLSLLGIEKCICAEVKLLHSSERYSSEKVDIIVFSYDRPMQLYALLESLDRWTTGLGNIYVVYRTSNDDFFAAYKQVVHDFDSFIFLKQSEVPESDFKQLCLFCLMMSQNRYVAFAVDGIIVQDDIDFRDCIRALEDYKAYGFFVRFGMNITWSHMQKSPCPVPQCEKVETGVYQWRFSDGIHDWGYSNNLDMTVYRKKDVVDALRLLPEDQCMSPLFESHWNNKADRSKTGLCYSLSKIVNCSINTVLPPHKAHSEQFTDTWKQCMHDYSPDHLLMLFNQGYKIDTNCVVGKQYRAPHIEESLMLIRR